GYAHSGELCLHLVWWTQQFANFRNWYASNFPDHDPRRFRESTYLDFGHLDDQVSRDRQHSQAASRQGVAPKISAPPAGPSEDAEATIGVTSGALIRRPAGRGVAGDCMSANTA